MNDYGYGLRSSVEPFEEEHRGILDTITSAVMKLFKRSEPEHYVYRSPIDESELQNYSIEPLGTYASASTFISPVSRMMCFEADGQLHVIQKMDSDRIFGSDARPIGDDLILTVLPRSYTDKIRDKLHKSEGRQFKEMTVGDFEQLLLFITMNPQVQKRTKASFISSLLTNRMDQEMLQDFAGDKVIIENSLLGKPIDVDSRRTWSLLNRNSKRVDASIEMEPERLEFEQRADGSDPRSMLIERNRRIQGHIDSSELELSQILQSREKGMDKTEIKNRNTRNVGSFSRFRSE